MKTTDIEKKAQRALIPFKLAASIRAMLDVAKADAKATAEEWADIEAKAIELVTEEA